MHMQEELRFVVTNGPDFDMELLEEAYIGKEQVADVRYVDGTWKTTFFPNTSVSGNPVCELSWDSLMKIQEGFSKFRAEMDAKRA